MKSSDKLICSSSPPHCQNPSSGLISLISLRVPFVSGVWILTSWHPEPLFPFYDIMGYPYPNLQLLIALYDFLAYVAIYTYFTLIIFCVFLLFNNYYTLWLFFKNITTEILYKYLQINIIAIPVSLPSFKTPNGILICQIP